MPATDAMREWVSSVLGVAFPGGPNNQRPPGLAADFQAAVKAWTAAVATVERQVAVLKSALISSGNDDYAEIANEHLDGVIGNSPNTLNAIVGKLATADDAAIRASAGKILPAMATLRQQIESNEAAEVCEANPVRVPISIRRTLTTAICRIEAVLNDAGTR